MKRIVTWIYPSCCPICDRIWNLKKGYCCPECKEKLPWIKGNVCFKCGKPVAEHMEYCEDCSTKRHLFTRGIAVFTYSEGLPDSIYRMKYQNRRDSIAFYADVMSRAVLQKQRIWKVQVILPVPMHWKRKARRGYNQSELLATGISEKTGIPVMYDWAKCIRQPLEQKRLNRTERQRNLRNCFQIQRNLKGLYCVLLVDDVYTTGSTMDELAGMLLASGIKEVYYVVLCIGKGKRQ